MASGFPVGIVVGVELTGTFIFLGLGWHGSFLASVLLMLGFRSVVYYVRGPVFLCPTFFCFTVGEQVLMSLVAVGIFHVVATKKGGSNPALLGSGAVCCSRPINP